MNSFPIQPRAQTVGILGGMGPAAGADFVRLFVAACADRLRGLGIAVSDQAFPEHWLAQVPVPDRSTALEALGHLGGHQPLDPMLQAMGKLAALGATAVAVACNTAHAWHETLQARFPHIEVLHVAREVARRLSADGVREVGLLATGGTYRAGLYDQALGEAGIVCRVPSSDERGLLMRGIYEGVKAGDLAFARDAFSEVAQNLAARHGLSTLVMGCTEIPLALSAAPAVPEMREVPELPDVPGLPFSESVSAIRGLRLVDAAGLLAHALAGRAYAPLSACSRI
ncbi:MAG: aspartate/glutamate racemase family protein [Comamonadaceae bacterium]|nr:MAG: aspartate/glutamate racemase family protein [Comamonadaceae bacterium]